MPATDIQVVTGSDSFILTNPSSRSRRVPKRPGIEKQINIPNPSGKEFRLTITISFEEYRQPGQEAGKPLVGVSHWRDDGVITRTFRSGRAN